MTPPNQINHIHTTSKKNWLNPQLTTIAASQIKQYAVKTKYPNNGALAVALPADTLLQPVTFLPVQQASTQRSTIKVSKRTPATRILRFTGYCLLLVVILPLLLFDAKRSAH